MRSEQTNVDMILESTALSLAHFFINYKKERNKLKTKIQLKVFPSFESLFRFEFKLRFEYDLRFGHEVR